jgi:hypothetical protein
MAAFTLVVAMLISWSSNVLFICKAKHILDFGLHPTSCPTSPAFRHYQATTDIVWMDELTLPVVYKSTHLCWIGWGSRQLSIGELACTFDLSSHCMTLVSDTTVLSQLFLLKFLPKPLQFLLESLAPHTPALVSLKVSLKGVCQFACDASVSVTTVATRVAKLAASPQMRIHASLIPCFWMVCLTRPGLGCQGNADGSVTLRACMAA